MSAETDSVIMAGCAARSNTPPSQRKWMPKKLDLDGFAATLDRCRDERIDLTNVPIGLLRMFYQSGVAFASFDPTPTGQRAMWLNSIIRPIKLLIALLSIAGAQCAVVDLGVMTERTGIMLDRATNRPDFFQYRIELIAQRWPSNSVVIVRTNDLLMIQDFVEMPIGPCLMAVHSICIDGEESSVSFYRVDVRREAPSAPGAHRVAVPARQSTNLPVQHLMRVHRNNQTNAIPPTPMIPVKINTAPNSGTGMTNDSSAAQMIKIQMRGEQGKRRSE